MPRYYFHIEDHQRFLDCEGTLLPDLQHARVEAVRVSGAMLAEHAAEFWKLGEWRVVVTDEHQIILFALSFAAVDHASLPAVYDLSSAGRPTAPGTNLQQSPLI
jgi:hypothetical protein